TFPIDTSIDKGVVVMNLQYNKGNSFKEFIIQNRSSFEEKLLDEVISLKEILEEIKTIGSIDLLSNAHQIVELMIDEKDLEIINFARREGQLWAQHSSLNIAVKLEWFQAIRRVFWDFLFNYVRLSEKLLDNNTLFQMERQYNLKLDTFLRHFFTSYTTYKDELIKTHRMMIDDLSVPLIPLTSTVFILPLLGTIDTHRAKAIQEKVLDQIGTFK